MSFAGQSEQSCQRWRKNDRRISRALQWNNVVGWTIQGHTNTLIANWWIPRAEMDRFLAELRERLRGPVELATIDWIWDEFERLAPDHGPTYSRNHRPTSPEKLREFDENGGIWLGIDVD